jgi:hypothetical protein
MTDRITFSRLPNGSFDLGESRLERLTDALFDGNPDPRIPASLMAAASKELISASHRAATANRIDFTAAVGLVGRERPALLKLTRARAVHDGDRTADVEVS